MQNLDSAPAEDVPSLNDLCGYVTPQYADDWKIIGLLLGLPFNALRVIEAEKPCDNKWCCDQILKRWQEVSDVPSWNKLFAAIGSPTPFSNCHSINKVPLLKHLYEHITPQFAADWKEIGTMLDIPSSELNAITAGNPTNAKRCCNAMLEKWLEIDTAASWEKIFSAINSPAVSIKCESKGDHIQRSKCPNKTNRKYRDNGDVFQMAENIEAIPLVAKDLGKNYKTTRFKPDKKTWPPEQSKHFTTLAFIYHKNERTQEQVITMAKTSIDDIMDTTDKEKCDDAYYCFEGSKATKNIVELLAPLDRVDSCCSRTILIEGAPGIGKSFLLKHIAYLWAIKQVLTSSKLLFLVCLRDPAVQNMSSINDLINYFCKQERLGQKCAAHLHNTDGKDVTILLDGFDELPEDLQDDGFITDLLEHKVLLSCNIIVSSRPHASAHLHNDVLLRVDILGFTEEDRECYIKESFNSEPKSANTLLQYLNNHPTISSLCFVPFIMSVLLFLFKVGKNLFESSTELYTHFVCVTICRHLANSEIPLEKDITDINDLPSPYNDIIKSLSKLSLKAISNNQLTFTLDEIKAACPGIDDIPGAINGFGLLQAVEHFSATRKNLSFHFIHFSIQEFLAAHCIANLSPNETTKVLEDYFWSKFHSNVFSMYVGITKGQQDSFKQFLCNESGNQIAEKFLTEQIKALHLYQCYYEAGDKKMCKHISEAAVFSGNAINLRGIPLLPSDINCLGLFLTNTHIKQWKRLELLSCNIRDVACRILHHAITHSASITIENVHLSANSLTSASAHYISDIVISCKAKLLYLNGNILGETDGLSNILKDSLLEEIYVHSNKLSSSSAISLFKQLEIGSHLRMLSLMYNDIHDNASNEIAAALQTNDSLQSLWINANPLSGETALSIVKALQSNNTLQLLTLPLYPYEFSKSIRKEVKCVNSIRRKQECYVELNIEFQ